jgi:hypothetical protein
VIWAFVSSYFYFRELRGVNRRFFRVYFSGLFGLFCVGYGDVAGLVGVDKVFCVAGWSACTGKIQGFLDSLRSLGMTLLLWGGPEWLVRAKCGVPRLPSVARNDAS